MTCIGDGKESDDNACYSHDTARLLVQPMDTTGSLKECVSTLFASFLHHSDSSIRGVILQYTCGKNRSCYFCSSRDSGFAYWERESAYSCPALLLDLVDPLALPPYKSITEDALPADTMQVVLSDDAGRLFIRSGKSGEGSAPTPDRRGGLRYQILEFAHYTDILLKNRKIFEEKSLEQKQTTIRLYISMLVHDIKNPLTGLSGFIQLLAQRIDDEIAQKYYALIQNTLVKLEKLSMESLALVKNGQLSIEDTPFDISELVAEFGTSREKKLEKLGVALKVNLPGNLTVKGEREKLRTAFDCIINNSCEAMAGTSGTITFSVAREERRIKIKIEDTGCGIPIYVLNDVGKLFFTHEKENHIGIGLAYVNSVIKAHRGTVELRSIYGRGTTITLNLPCID